VAIRYSSAPTLVDIDGDGDLDLVSDEGAYGGVFLYFENTGSTISPTFVERTGASNPLEGFAVGAYSTPTFVDFDGDADLDLVAGEETGNFFYFENTGSVLSLAFTQRNGAANPFIGLNTGAASNPALADLDWDGDLELVSGESTGTLLYFENQSAPPATVPVGGWWFHLLVSLGMVGTALPHFGDRGRRFFIR
jgi:hypothetical protein